MMKNFTLKTILFILPVVIIIILANFYVDPANLFSNKYEKKIASLILNGKDVTNVANYDERLLQKEIIEGLPESPEIVILGSSRTMLIGTDFFDNKTIMNSSVSGASIQDLIAIAQIYKKNKKYPKKIIIGVDPWLFNENNGQNRWGSIAEEYYRFVGSEDLINSSMLNKMSQLYSLTYFQATLKQLISTKESEPIIALKKRNESLTKLSDGSIIYDKKYREVTQEQVSDKVVKYIRGGIYSIENYTSISDDIKNEFDFLILELKNHSIDVEFYLLPYHPKVFEVISKNKKYNQINKIERFIFDYAERNSIKCIGSYDPNHIGFTEKDFFDGMHCKKESIKKIIN